MVLAAPVRELNLTVLVLSPKFLWQALMASFGSPETTNCVQGTELEHIHIAPVMTTGWRRSNSWEGERRLERSPANHPGSYTVRTKTGMLTGVQRKKQKTSTLGLWQSWRTAWTGKALRKQYEKASHHRGLYERGPNALQFSPLYRGQG